MKNKIKEHLKEIDKDAIENDYYIPTKFGDSKSTTFEINGLAKSFCTTTEWANGEGYDISFQTKNTVWEDKRISLHSDELECLMSCLNELKYFD